MAAFKLALPALLLLLCAIPSVANAQSSFQFQYHIEVRVEYWPSGSASWQTEFTTTDYEEGQTMLELYELALDSGGLSQILGLSWKYIATDVRLRTEYPQMFVLPSNGYSWAYTRPPYVRRP